MAGAGNGKGMADDSEDSSDAPFCWLGVWPAKEKDELKGRPPVERRREEKIKGRGGRLPRVQERKKCSALRVFWLPPLIAKLPPLFCLSIGPVFIGKMLHGSQNWSLNFFFCKFDFS